MFKRNKLVVAVAVSLGFFSSIAFAADLSDDPDVLFPGIGGTVDEVQPKIWFEYDPAASGIFVDLKAGVDSATPPMQVDDVDDVTACGDVVVSEYVPLADGKIDCTHTALPSGSDTSTAVKFCTYAVPSTLTDGLIYNVAISSVDFSAPSTITARVCGQVGALTQNFKVDTSTAPVVTPDNPPSPVTITWPATSGGDCIITNTNKPTGANTAYTSTGACAVEFTQDNTDAAESYRVWINDKNGIQVSEDVLSSLGTDGTTVAVEENGWMYIDTSTAAANANLTLKCDVDLANLRTCVINIGSAFTSFGSTHMPIAGAPYKVWVAPWNAKGYSTRTWSDSLEIDKTVE